MTRATILVRAVSLLVPAARRQEWIKEWLAELHYAEEHAGEAESYAFARGAIDDALWQHHDFWTLKRTMRLLQSPRFCLASAGVLLAAVIVASGFLPRTRQALFPLPYRDPGRLVLIAQSQTMATRAAEPISSIALWRKSSQTLEGIATYQWDGKSNTASVSENFFQVLGADVHPSACTSCVVLSHDYARSLHGAHSVTIAGKPYRVAAVTPRSFWFLSPNIDIWRIEKPGRKSSAGVLARLRPGVTAEEAGAELSSILGKAEINQWETLVELTGISSRVRSVFLTFAFAVGLAILIVLPAMRLRMPQWNPRAAGFFLAKTALLLTTVMLCGIEFTRAASITTLGGADGYTAVSAWLYVMGSTAVLAWAITDQRQRCRVCLKRLGMAAHVGCTGCLLLDWAGTELVCVEGHGMLHVPEMAASWQDPDKWTFLDESWQDLFVERTA